MRPIAVAVIWLCLTSTGFAQQVGDEVFTIMRGAELKTGSSVVGKVDFGKLLKIEKTNGDWFWVNSYGTKGWINRKHVSSDYYCDQAVTPIEVRQRLEEMKQARKGSVDEIARLRSQGLSTFKYARPPSAFAVPVACRHAPGGFHWPVIWRADIEGHYYDGRIKEVGRIFFLVRSAEVPIDIKDGSLPDANKFCFFGGNYDVSHSHEDHVDFVTQMNARLRKVDLGFREKIDAESRRRLKEIERDEKEAKAHMQNHPQIESEYVSMGHHKVKRYQVPVACPHEPGGYHWPIVIYAKVQSNDTGGEMKTYRHIYYSKDGKHPENAIELRLKPGTYVFTKEEMEKLKNGGDIRRN